MRIVRYCSVTVVFLGVAMAACSGSSSVENSGENSGENDNASDGGGARANDGSASSLDGSIASTFFDGSSATTGTTGTSGGDDDDASPDGGDEAPDGSHDVGDDAGGQITPDGSTPSCSCAYNQHCLGSSDTCTDVPFMSLGFSSSYSGTPASLTGYSEIEFLSAPQYTTLPDGGIESAQTTTVDGCTVTTSRQQSNGTFHSNTYSADVGTVTITGGPNGSDVFTTGANEAGTNDIYSGSLGSTPVYTGRDALTISATGGADYPSFTTTLTTRPPVQITAFGTLVVGQPLSVQWSGANGVGTIDVYASTDQYTAATMTFSSVSVSCIVPDNGSFAIPADVTSQLQATHDVAELEVFATQQIRIEPTGKNVVILVDAQTSASATLN